MKILRVTVQQPQAQDVDAVAPVKEDLLAGLEFLDHPPDFPKITLLPRSQIAKTETDGLLTSAIWKRSSVESPSSVQARHVCSPKF